MKNSSSVKLSLTNSVFCERNIVRITNQLNNVDSVLEAARMENKSLSDSLITLTKEKAKLQNKLQSQLHSRRLEAQKFNEYVTQNQKLKEEILMVRKNLENINRNHAEKCKEVETMMEQNKVLKLNIEELKKKIALLEQERGSYKKTTSEMKKTHTTILELHGNEAKYSQQLEGAKKIVKENSQNLTIFKSQLVEVLLRYKSS